MSLYEILTLSVALLGAITGLTSLIRTRRIAAKQLEFQAIAAALTKRQLLVLERDQAATHKADVGVELVQIGRGEFRFVLTNRGHSTAENVHFKIADDSPDNPLVGNECQQKLPFPKLDPGQSFTLIAARHMGSALRYATHISWRNEDGSIGSQDAHLAL